MLEIKRTLFLLSTFSRERGSKSIKIWPCVQEIGKSYLLLSRISEDFEINFSLGRCKRSPRNYSGSSKNTLRRFRPLYY